MKILKKISARLPRIRGDRPLREYLRADCESRLPRIRGDRPCSGLQPCTFLAAPPHTRGSTPSPRQPPAAPPGSPAYAGIDLSILPAVDSQAGLPRIRGDRPRILLFGAENHQAPPHTRGSTFAMPQSQSYPRGSPAYAGIDLRDAEAPLQEPWLPRIRGDRPGCWVTCFWVCWAPPHTRGSTCKRVRASRGLGGSPAYAGIDLA